MKKRERVILRLDAEEHSIDGQILTYIKDDPIVSSRDAVMRALKAFYLLWVLEGRQGEDMRAIAKTTIEELQYRAFQIQQRFLSTEEMNMVLASPSSPNQVVSVEAQSGSGLICGGDSQRDAPADWLNRAGATFG